MQEKGINRLKKSHNIMNGMRETTVFILLSFFVSTHTQGQLDPNNYADIVRTAIANGKRQLGARYLISLQRSTPVKVPLHIQLQAIYLKRNVELGRIQELSDQSSVIHYAALELKNRTNVNENKFNFDESPLANTFNDQISSVCDYRRPTCDYAYPYRLPDGTCNNLVDSLLGSSVTPLQRVASSNYEGVNDPRTWSNTRNQNGGKVKLPNPRNISDAIHTMRKSYNGSDVIAAILPRWGQFIEHDMVSTPAKLDGNAKIIQCCSVPENLRDEECLPLITGKDCMDFVRSETAPPLECVFAPRQQINQHTSFIDGSALYGNSQAQEDSLRDMKSKGLLRTSESYNLLPSTPIRNDARECRIDAVDAGSGALHCFDSGDHRSTLSPALVPIYVLLLREHNRIATILGRINDHWDNETVYQVSKKIVVAMIQHITYNEYLPIVLNHQERVKYGLHSTQVGYQNIYNNQLDPRTINAFSVAANKFLHSLLPGSIGHADLNFTTIKTFQERHHFFRPKTVWMGEGRGVDFFARWLTANGQSVSDNVLEPDFTDFYYLDEGTGKAFDLPAINIQRGRDHGLPGYNAYRRYCNLRQAYYFGSGLYGFADHSPDVIQQLKKIYKSPDDIDLFTGGLTEQPLPDSLVGPTFSCLIGLQFHLAKHGDRFWYENPFQTGFTEFQLNSIKRQSLAKLLCRNFHFQSVQPAAFVLPSTSPAGRNQRTECSRYVVGDINFELWRERNPNDFRLGVPVGGPAPPGPLPPPGPFPVNPLPVGLGPLPNQLPVPLNPAWRNQVLPPFEAPAGPPIPPID